MRNMSIEDLAGSCIHKPQIHPVDNATVPYWRTELHDIDEYRSMDTLPSECDIAIIGAGMAGVGTAYHLSKATEGKQRPSIVLVDARQVCSGATGRNGGHVKVQTNSIPKYIERYGYEATREVVELIRKQAYDIKRVVETESLDCEFELRRSFDVFIDQTKAEASLRAFEDHLRRGESWTEDISVVKGQNVEQITSIRDAKAAFSVPIASLWPYKFVSQLLSRLIDNQAVNLQTNTPVLSVTQSDGHNILRTPRGSIKAKKVVFATNGYTAGLLSAYKNKIIPTRATASHITTPSPVSPHLSHTYNINFGTRPSGADKVDYLNPRPDGSIVVGGGRWTYSDDRSKWYNQWDDSVQLEESRPHFEGLMQRHFLGWKESGARLHMMWTGIQGVTKDEMPHIGEVPGSERSQSIIAGFNGGGMGTIFSCTRGLAEMIVNDVEFEETNIPRLFKTTADRLRQ